MLWRKIKAGIEIGSYWVLRLSEIPEVIIFGMMTGRIPHEGNI